MKKSLILAAACVALVACNKNVSDNGGLTRGNVITFTSPVTAPTTKVAGIIDQTTGYNTAEDFHVYGYSHPGNFNFGNAALYMDTDVRYRTEAPIKEDTGDGLKAWWPWNGTGYVDYYWPKNTVDDVKLSFIAYSPADAVTSPTVAANGLSFGYTVKGLTAQEDLLYSAWSTDKTTSLDTETANANNIYDGVDIVFNHALSAVLFTVRTKETYATQVINLTKVEILNVANKGTFTQGPTTQWAVDAAAAKASYTVFDSEQLVTPTPLPVCGAEGATDALNKNALGGATGYNYAMLMPQTFDAPTGAIAPDTDAVVKVTYTMSSTATGAATYESVAYYPLASTCTGTADAGKWIEGKRYTYNIEIGLDCVYFAPIVTSWVDVTGGTIEIQ